MTTTWPTPIIRPDRACPPLLRPCGCEFDPWVFGHDYAFCRLMRQVRARRQS